MFPAKRDPSSSIFSDDFSVQSGPSHVAWPLGHSATHDHYIKPVPPFYVTEYEASYKWPSPAKPPLVDTDFSNDLASKARDNVRDYGVHEEKNDEKQTEKHEKVKKEQKDQDYSVVSPPPPTNEERSLEKREKKESPWQTMEQSLNDLTFLENQAFLASRVKAQVNKYNTL